MADTILWYQFLHPPIDFSNLGEPGMSRGEWRLLWIFLVNAAAVTGSWMWATIASRHRVRGWHGGKILIIWLVSAVALFAALSLSRALIVEGEDRPLVALLLGISVPAVAIAVLTPIILTWIWLGARETHSA